MNKKLKHLLIVAASTVIGLSLIGCITSTRPAPPLIVEVTDETIDLEVDVPEVPVFFELYLDDAECELCARQRPIIEKLAAEYAGRIKFVRANARKQVAIANTINIRPLPAYIVTDWVVDDGFAIAGLADEAKLRELIERIIRARAELERKPPTQ